MSETWHEPRLIDHVGITRELRGAAQALAYQIMTGESPTVVYGWQRDTCIEEFDQLNAVGRFCIRLAPAQLALLISFVIALGSYRTPSGWLWLPVGYFAVVFLLLVGYDLFWGAVGLLRGVKEATA